MTQSRRIDSSLNSLRGTERRIGFLSRFAGYFIVICAATGFILLGCPIRYFTGIPCPGCGMTRACISALHFHFHDAFLYHPLFPLVFAVGLAFLFFAIRIYSQASGTFLKRTEALIGSMRNLSKTKGFLAATIIAAALLITIYLVRMSITLFDIESSWNMDKVMSSRLSVL